MGNSTCNNTFQKGFKACRPTHCYVLHPFLIYMFMYMQHLFSFPEISLYVYRKKPCASWHFSKFDPHSSPLFKKSNIVHYMISLSDCNIYVNYMFKNRLLPLVYSNFFLLSSAKFINIIDLLQNSLIISLELELPMANLMQDFRHLLGFNIHSLKLKIFWPARFTW